MNILHITDSHGTVKSPEGRTDIYYLSFLKKMYEIKYIIKQYDIKLIIHTGDLFHSPRVSDKFTGQLAEIIKSYGIPMYVVPGNHDIEGYNINTLDQTKLGLLYKTGVVNELSRNTSPISIKSKSEGISINISGQEYYKDIDTGNMDDFQMKTSNSADVNILAIHGYLCDKPQNPNINHTLCSNIVTDADIILSGHFHESFIYNGPDFSVCNPGSMMRVEANAYNKKHKPQYGILNIENNNGSVTWNYNLHEFQIAEPSKDVFDFKAKDLKKKTLITLENFKNSIANTNFNDDLSVSIEKMIQDVADNMSLQDPEKTDVINRSKTFYNNALNNYPDKLEVQNGFIRDINRKILKSVTIKNFQSHEDTKVEFKDGLNVIIGESNTGKTSILRAIKWVIDNDPSGSDFITTGANECEVTVEFDDGTKLTRRRTRKDTGTYEVTGKTEQPDGTITYWNDTYRGFSNDIPVEVSNIHQMPKINLTKDLSMHLNMMSQLDGPFLIADSPQVRASVIGRLTGTQVIDLAIKDVNKAILDNSKEINVYKQQKQDAEYALSLVNIDVISRFYEKLDKLNTYVANNFGVLEEAMTTFDKANNTKMKVNDYMTLLYAQENTVKLLSGWIAILSYVDNQKNISDTHKEYVNTYNKIINFKNSLVKLNAITSLKKFTDISSDRISKLGRIQEICNKYYSIKQSLDNDKKFLSDYTNMVNNQQNAKKCLEDILKYYNFSLNVNNNSSSLITKYNTLKMSIERNEEILKNCNTEIDKLNKEINKLNKQQLKLIKENNICPCCGQKLSSKEHIINVNNFFKEEHKCQSK